MSWVPKILLCLSFLPACRCPSSDDSATAAPRVVPVTNEPDPADRPSSLQPPARDPGPPRAETEEQVEGARQEARKLAGAMLKGGVAHREVCSMADIRGYRLFRRRYFKQAQVWFETAVKTDPTFEPALYNAARAGAAAGDGDAARAHIRTLRKLSTPMARRRLRAARKDPDLSRVLRAGPKNRPR